MTNAFFTALAQSSRLRLGLALSALALSACGSLDSASNSVLSVVTPYRPEVVQGNVIVKEQIALLKPGLSKLQVRQLLGTPLVTSVFHADRWDYVFTINRQGTDPQQRKLTLFFKGDQLDRFAGDPMPSETEFITSITRTAAFDKPQRLQATPEELVKFQEANPASPDTSLTALPAGPLNAYPPLESGAAR